MKYLIFGAGGFVGKTLGDFLKKEKNEVIAAQRNGEGDVQVDITSALSFSTLNDIDDIDIIINCASVLPDSSRKFSNTDYLSSLFYTNVIGAANILNFAAGKKIKRVINCSTLVVVNKPWPVPLKETDEAYPRGNHTGYCVSKLSQELVMNELAKKHNIQLLHLRLSSIYGNEMVWQGIIPTLIEKSINSEDILLTNADKTSFDFLLVDDLVKIIYKLSQISNWSETTLNTASGKEIYLKQLAEDVIHLTKSNSIIEFKNNDQPVSRSSIDISLLKKTLGDQFEFTPLKNGLKAAIDHYKMLKCVI